MKTNRKTLVTLLVALLLFAFGCAPGHTSTPTSAAVQGPLKPTATEAPLPYAKVIIDTAKDGSITGGCYTPPVNTQETITIFNLETEKYSLKEKISSEVCTSGSSTNLNGKPPLTPNVILAFAEGRGIDFRFEAKRSLQVYFREGGEIIERKIGDNMSYLTAISAYPEEWKKFFEDLLKELNFPEQQS